MEAMGRASLGLFALHHRPLSADLTVALSQLQRKRQELQHEQLLGAHPNAPNHASDSITGKVTSVRAAIRRRWQRAHAVDEQA